MHCNIIIQYKLIKCTFYKIIFYFIYIFFSFLVSSTCFENKGLLAGRQFCIQLWCNAFYMDQYNQSCMQKNLLILMHVKVPYHKSVENRLPEDDSLASKHSEGIKNV